MTRFNVLAALVVAAAFPVAGAAQVCSETNSVGPYTVDFLGASFDGVDTEFEYCITSDTYLNEWKLFLDPLCTDAATITECGPSSCGWDETDGISGILFDGLNVGPGVTECFTFSLAGDWTGQIGEGEIRLKNNEGGNKVTEICGPICRGCEPDCPPDPFCGDFNVDPGEQCDDGNTEDCDGCSSICEDEMPGVCCGDGIVNLGEECDDGNTVDGDGCDATCSIEPFCGDGNVDPGEECDDGNTMDGDGCSADCEIVEPVPTLGEWGLILFALALAGLGSAALSRRKRLI